MVVYAQQGYMGEKQGHTVECAGVAMTQRTGLNFVLTELLEVCVMILVMMLR